MREKTYHLYLNEEERSRVIQSLIELKNNLAAQGRFKNDIFGDYIRYTHASCHSAVNAKHIVCTGININDVSPVIIFCKYCSHRILSP